MDPTWCKIWVDGSHFCWVKCQGIFFEGLNEPPKLQNSKFFFGFFPGVKLVSWKKTWKRNRDNFRDVFPLDFAWHWFWVSYSCLLLECFSLRNLQGVDPDVFYKVYRPLPLGPSLEDGEFTWPLWRWLVKWPTQRFGIKKRSLWITLKFESPGVVAIFCGSIVFFPFTFEAKWFSSGWCEHENGQEPQLERWTAKHPGTHSNGKNGAKNGSGCIS